MTVTRDAEVGEVSRPANGARPAGVRWRVDRGRRGFLALAMVPAVVSGYPVYILPQYMLFGVWRCRSACCGASSAS